MEPPEVDPRPVLATDLESSAPGCYYTSMSSVDQSGSPGERDETDLSAFIAAETAKRHRRNRALRTPDQRMELARQMQMDAYRVMQANPAAWQAFLKRNHAKRSVPVASVFAPEDST